MSHAKSFPRRRESSAQVVPAQAGIQCTSRSRVGGNPVECERCWVPACAGMTDEWEAHPEPQGGLGGWG